MATLYIQAVNHKLYTNNYFSNLSDEEKDKIYYKVSGTEKPTLNYKQFIIEQPKIRLQLTDYLFNLIKDEMFYENYHNIVYKKVENKEFYKRIKNIKYQKIRFYFEDRWITYYFNVKSKHKVTESDFPVALALYAAYPAKGVFNFLLQPCTKEGGNGFVKCWSDMWKICAFIEGLESEEDYCDMSDTTCYDPPYRLKFENYFYTFPGENDYLLEAYTIDYDKGIYKDKSSEYYIVDREGDYFKKGTTKLSDLKELVLKRFNESPERIELYMDKKVKRKIIAYKTSNTFKTFEDMFKYLGRSWIGRHNAFFLQWNQYMKYFNESSDGYYCPPSSPQYISETVSQEEPVLSPYVDVRFSQKSSDSLIQETIEGYVKKEYNISILQDIKILTMFDYLKFTISTDKWLELLDINAKTSEILKEHLIINHQTLDGY